MNIGAILIYLIFSVILFVILEFANSKKINYTNHIIISLIYIIILGGLFTNYKDNLFLVIVFELLMRILYTTKILEKNTFKDNKYLETYLISIFLAYLVNTGFINKVDSVFLDMSELKIIIWVLIFIFVYIMLKDKLNITIKTDNKRKIKNYDDYIIVSYAKLKNKYSEYVVCDIKLLIPVVYSIMVFNSYKRPSLFRKIDYIRYNFNGKKDKLGIMQVKSNKYISDEESIELSIKKLLKIYNKLSSDKKLNKKDLVSDLLKEYDKSNADTILDIYNIIVNFDKK